MHPLTLSIPSTERPEIEFLIRRWGLPPERATDVLELMEMQAKMGGTASDLASGIPVDPSAWGDIARAEDVGATPKPLVLSRAGADTCLQSWRHYNAERFIARELRSRARRPPAPLSNTPETLIGRLEERESADNRVLAPNTLQMQAIRHALESCLAIVTGGPGTGKTTVVAHLLALLVDDRPDNPPVIRMAAPTGKAALRMRDAVKGTRTASHFKPIEGELGRIAGRADTLHQLLGFNPATGCCRFNADNRLRADVVVIDECSMVDTLLWQSLLAALEESTRLILLGDPNQLESVAEGDVLGSLVRRDEDGSPSPLASSWVRLVENHRSGDMKGIVDLAKALEDRDADAAVGLLKAHEVSGDTAAGSDERKYQGLMWHGDHGKGPFWDGVPETVKERLMEVAKATTPGCALEALDRIRILTPFRGRKGLGAIGLSQKINQAIRREMAKDHPGRVPNEPVIINRNDPETGLKNGSVGVLMSEGAGRAAYFPGKSGERPLRFELSQLPGDRNAAWAMTVHRSQGSEFDKVFFVLPDPDSKLATRELVYTAITRAKKGGLHVRGSDATLRGAAGSKTSRRTLLAHRLRDPEPPPAPGDAAA